MTQEREKRLREVLKEAGTLLFLGAAYALFVRLTGFMIPCPVRTITGYRCPGCGITHFFLSLLSFDFRAAFAANPLIFILAPPALIYYLYRTIRYIRSGNSGYSRLEAAMLYAVLLATILFGVMRNQVVHI